MFMWLTLLLKLKIKDVNTQLVPAAVDDVPFSSLLIQNKRQKLVWCVQAVQAVMFCSQIENINFSVS